MIRPIAVIAACFGLSVISTLPLRSEVTTPPAATTQLPTPGEAALVGEGQTPGNRVVIRSLKRDPGGTVTLRFELANDGPNALKTYGVLGDLFTMSYLSLIDAANKKRYLVVTDSAKTCLCAELKDDVTPGTKFNLWATFPAPPDTVQSITVVVPGFEPIESVPIAAAGP
jgi:hypothetical protein